MTGLIDYIPQTRRTWIVSLDDVYCVIINLLTWRRAGVGAKTYPPANPYLSMDLPGLSVFHTNPQIHT